MEYIQPSWPAPRTVKAFSTTRQLGSSLGPFSSFNLALHVGDQSKDVESNRLLLEQSLQLPAKPAWLQQVHGNQVLEACADLLVTPVADAATTAHTNVICAIMTADCLPILLCNRQGSRVAAIHAGWRGIANGVIENTLNLIQESPAELLVWLGPGISQDNYEVSEEIFKTFIDQDPQNSVAFKPNSKAQNKWFADLYLLATLKFKALGITAIYGGEYCTFDDQPKFFSYRRDGVTGRMASLIWLAE